MATALLRKRLGAALVVLAALASGLPTGHSAPPAGAGPHVSQIPALALPDLEGQERSLADWKDRVILLNFWATWCAPCRYEIPDLIEFQARHGPEGLQVVGIGLDEERKLANFARTLRINYPVLVADPQRDLQLLRDWVYRRAGTFGEEELETYVLPLLTPHAPARLRSVSAD
jgi:thiol-disulfide isomerase/thioredoxin